MAYEDFDPFAMQADIDWDLTTYETTQGATSGGRGQDTTPEFNLADVKPFLPEDWDATVYNYAIDQASYYEGLYGDSWSYGDVHADTSSIPTRVEDCYIYYEEDGWCCTADWECWMLEDYADPTAGYTEAELAYGTDLPA